MSLKADNFQRTFLKDLQKELLAQGHIKKKLKKVWTLKAKEGQLKIFAQCSNTVRSTAFFVCVK